MTAALRFDPIRLPEECEKLRKEVRAFLAEEVARGTFDPHSPQGGDIDVPGFSKPSLLGTVASNEKARVGVFTAGLIRDTLPVKLGLRPYRASMRFTARPVPGSGTADNSSCV